jgi:flagellar biosynthesis regulator FlaF
MKLENSSSISTSTNSEEYDEIYKKSPSKARDLLKDRIGGLDLSTIIHIKEYIEQVVKILADPTEKYEPWEPESAKKSRINIISQRVMGESKIPELKQLPKLPPPKKTNVVDIGDSDEQFTKQDLESLLQSSIEYVALFKVNRPVQSDISNMEDLRKTELIYAQLLEDVKSTLSDVKALFNSNLVAAIQSLSLWLADRAEHLKKAHLKDMEVVKGAYKSIKNDALKRVAHDSEVNFINFRKRNPRLN